MDAHEEAGLLSAYLDGELSGAERASLDAHLPRCGACRAELESLSRAKALTSRAARRPLPADILARLEKRARGRAWPEGILERLMLAPRLAPAAALAGLFAALALWHSRSAREREALPLEALLAAHSRYTAESLVPTDLVASNFSAELAAYYGED